MTMTVNKMNTCLILDLIPIPLDLTPITLDLTTHNP